MHCAFYEKKCQRYQYSDMGKKMERCIVCIATTERRQSREHAFYPFAHGRATRRGTWGDYHNLSMPICQYLGANTLTRKEEILQAAHLLWDPSQAFFAHEPYAKKLLSSQSPKLLFRKSSRPVWKRNSSVDFLMNSDR